MPINLRPSVKECTIISTIIKVKPKKKIIIPDLKNTLNKGISLLSNNLLTINAIHNTGNYIYIFIIIINIKIKNLHV